jgi:hypothetical protein
VAAKGIHHWDTGVHEGLGGINQKFSGLGLPVFDTNDELQSGPDIGYGADFDVD